MNRYLKISEFARMSGIARKNLIFYNEIGLLSPERVEENGYRFYSYRQLEAVSVIAALRETGMPLRDIKSYLDRRTPGELLQLFSKQKTIVEEKISKLQRIRCMIETRVEMTRHAAEIDPEEIVVRDCEEEALFAGGEVHGTDEESVIGAITEFYDDCDLKQVTYGYPFSTIVSRENLLRGEWQRPSGFFFKFPAGEGRAPTYVKPAGLYLIGYEKTDYDGPKQIYSRLFAAVKKKHLSICGNSYEEFLLDEVAVNAPERYLLQVSIQVRRCEV